MIPVRHLLLGAGAVVALVGASLFLRLSPEERFEPKAPPAAAASVGPVAATTTLRAKAAAPDLRDLPAGIIARAANARSLERAPACRPQPPRDESACAPQRDTVEIRWDVAKEP